MKIALTVHCTSDVPVIVTVDSIIMMKKIGG